MGLTLCLKANCKVLYDWQVPWLTTPIKTRYTNVFHLDFGNFVLQSETATPDIY